jgi:hypothetical protein
MNPMSLYLNLALSRTIRARMVKECRAIDRDMTLCHSQDGEGLQSEG